MATGNGVLFYPNMTGDTQDLLLLCASILGVVLPEDVQLTLTSCSPVPDDNESDTSSASPPVTSNVQFACPCVMHKNETLNNYCSLLRISMCINLLYLCI